MLAVRKLSNARLYVEGVNQTGLCESVELPEVEMRVVEYDPLGMAGKIELPDSFEAMEATMVWSHQPPEVADLMMNPYFTSAIQLRSNQATFTGSGLPTNGAYVVQMRVRPKVMAGGEFVKGEGVKPETTFAVDFYSITVEGKVLFELDASSTEGIIVNGRLVNFLGE